MIDVDTINAATPPTLRQRAAEAAEYRRKLDAYHGSRNLERLLLGIGVIGHPLPTGAIVFDNQGTPHYDTEGVRFSLRHYGSYTDEHEGTTEPEHDSLDANLLCPGEECRSVAGYGHVYGIRSLADLDQLFVGWQHIKDNRCYHCHNNIPLDKRDDDLSSIPF
jgi:hypothetical protein